MVNSDSCRSSSNVFVLMVMVMYKVNGSVRVAFFHQTPRDAVRPQCWRHAPVVYFSSPFSKPNREGGGTEAWITGYEGTEAWI